MKVIIVGGVAGGAGVATRLSRVSKNAEIIMFEKNKHISFANCGLPYYIGDKIVNNKNLVLYTPEEFKDKFNVDVRINQKVVKIYDELKTVLVHDINNDRYYEESYDKLVLSPGGKPRLPEIEGIKNENVFTLRNVSDSYNIKEYINIYKPKKAVILGSGFIGLELLENLYELGIDVTVIEKNDHILSSFDEDMIIDIHNNLKEKNIKIILNNQVVKINKNNVILEDNKVIETDIIIVSIGIEPDTDFIIGSNIKLNKKKEIKVDKYLETSVKNIFALGDAIEETSFITNKKTSAPFAGIANRQARIVADNLLNKININPKVLKTSIIKIFDYAIASTGENEKTLQKLNIKYHKLLYVGSTSAEYYPDSKDITIKILFSLSGKILGSQVFGEKDVDKKIDILATAIKGRINILELKNLELAYAPPFNTSKDAINTLGYISENLYYNITKPIFYNDIINSNDYLIIDLRLEEDFKELNINNSINIPYKDFKKKYKELPKDRKIALICKYGILSYNIEQFLRQEGYDAYNYTEGFELYKKMLFYQKNK